MATKANVKKAAAKKAAAKKAAQDMLELANTSMTAALDRRGKRR